MKNSNRSNQFWKKLQDKGYYIVLFLCILAVGISGYIFVSTAIRNNRIDDETLSVPVTPDKLPSSSQSGTPTVGPLDDETPQTPVTPPQPTEEELRQKAKSEAVAPLQGEVIQTFSMESLSYNETTRDWRLHTAVDIAAQGDVSACMTGTVTDVYEDEFYGVTVVISHDGGYETRYANLAEARCSIGDAVDPGEVIGTVGSSAMLESGSQPHLHFQVLLKGEPQDPAEFMN